MSNIDFGFQMLSNALSNLQQSRYRSALGQGLGPFGQDQSNDPGAVPAQNPGGQPDKISPGSSASMIKRAAPFMDDFRSASARTGVPLNLLLGVSATESGFNPRARNPSGAAGLMQFIPSTAKQFGIDPYNPTQSINAAADYLKRLYTQNGNSWDRALNAYSGGGGAQYVGQVRGYAFGPFSGFGGTGGAPSDAAVASGGGGVTPPPPRPLPDSPPFDPRSLDTSSTDQPMPSATLAPVDPTSPGSAAAGPQASAAPRFPEAAGMVASADTGSATDVQPPVMPADDTPQLIEGLKRARANAGLPTVPDDFLAAQIKQMGTQRAKQVIQQLAGAQPRPPTGGAPRAVPPPSAPSPAAGAAAAAGGPGAQRVTAGPGLSPAAGAAAAAGGADRRTAGPSPVPLPRVRPSDQERAAASPTGHPADAKPTPDEIKQASAGDESNPPWPGKEGLNPQGYFPYQSVYGNKFTLPQLIYNIKKANPGINPAVLAGAVLLAQPMLRDAANEHVRDYQETMREYMETQRETAAQTRLEETLSSKEKTAETAHEDRVAALSSLDAYRKATTQQRGERMAQEMLYKNQELKDREKNNADKLETARKQLTLNLSREQRNAASQQFRDTLAAQRDLEQQKHNAIVDEIRTSSALTYAGDREQALKDEDARLKEATARLDAFERQLRARGKSSAAVAPAPTVPTSP